MCPEHLGYLTETPKHSCKGGTIPFPYGWKWKGQLPLLISWLKGPHIHCTQTQPAQRTASNLAKEWGVEEQGESLWLPTPGFPSPPAPRGREQQKAKCRLTLALKWKWLLHPRRWELKRPLRPSPKTGRWSSVPAHSAFKADNDRTLGT